MSQFAFLEMDFPPIFALAKEAEESARNNPQYAALKTRICLEEMVEWLYVHENMQKPYETTLSAKIKHPPFIALLGQGLILKANIIKNNGNSAAHDKNFKSLHTIPALKELHHLGYWLVKNYGRQDVSNFSEFQIDKLPRNTVISKENLILLQEAAKRYGAEIDKRKLVEEELAKARAEIAALKAQNAKTPDKHDYKEAETRDAFIDILLEEAGWDLSKPNIKEFRITGLKSPEGVGFCDYVLWGDDGKPLAVIEAKRTKRDASAGREQARLYADSLTAQFTQRPVIFYTNGYEHFMWDDVNAPPRSIQGFLTKDELERIVLRRSTRATLSEEDINQQIVNRYYQKRAITKVSHHFEVDNQRKALLVMATGSGKTRTVIALSELLMRKNWAFRVLFLADRKSLVKQAANAFKKFYPASSPVNLLDNSEATGRVYLSTYQTMMGLINDKTFGVGHFDLIVVDEAHRSVYNKYKNIFDYFDGLLVGLTATPKDEIDKNTYGLFNVQNGVPTDVYTLEDGVKDGHLVPPRVISASLPFLRDGIKYDKLSDEEKEEWDTLDWQEEPPEEVNSGAINKWLFNIDTVDKVLEHLMREGYRVNEGERLGKTIIFAKNHQHAEFILERFNANYPHYKGKFAKVIDNYIENAQQIIDDFSEKDGSPHIAISVDMLDTGIDVPEVLNLVFFKLVRSKSKFNQMIGRGTRLCPDLFGIGQDKKNFLIFDFCENFDFFNQNADKAEPATTEPLTKRIFTSRLELLENLQGKDDYAHVLKEFLFAEVQSLSMDNFIVRPKRKFVEIFQQKSAWEQLNGNNFYDLRYEIAPLHFPSQDEELEAKQFDLLIHNTQLSHLKGEAKYTGLKAKIIEIASILETKQNIPIIKKCLAEVLEFQTESFWVDVTLQDLERARLALRGLVHLIEKAKLPLLVTNFKDGDISTKEIRHLNPNVGVDLEAFKKKARHFLKPYESHLSLIKLKRNEQLTKQDLQEFERIFLENEPEGLNTEKVKQEIGLPHFIRSLVGLEREAAKKSFDVFLSNHHFNHEQIEFINMTIDFLARNGEIKAEIFYESPFIDKHSAGLSGIFNEAEIIEFNKAIDSTSIKIAA